MSTSVEKLETMVEIPEEVSASMERHVLTVKGPLGKTHKNFSRIPVKISVGDGGISVGAMGSRKRDYAIMNTARSLVRNICEGVLLGYTIKMKIVYAHFPITVKMQKDKVLIENFQGERAARVAKILGKTRVKPDGDDVIVTGHVLTDVTQTAANIQLKTKVKKKDRRVFLDGIYVYDKQTGMAE
jgi:large subunit ribosomal protein L6